MKFLNDYIKQFINFLKIEKCLSANTSQAYRNDLKEFELFVKIKNYDIKNINILYDYLSYIQHHSVTTQKRKLVALKQFLKFCKNENLFYNEFLEIKIKSTSLPSRFIQKDEMDRVKEYLKNEKNLKLIYIINVLYSTGMRVSEFLSLKIADIACIIKYNKLKIIGKGDKERYVYFNDSSIESLNNLINSNSITDKVYILKLTRQRVHKILKEFASKYGLELSNIFPHSFRHRMLTDLVQNGANIISVQKIAGHQNLSTIEKYTHVEEFLYEEIKKFHPLNKIKNL